MLILKKLSEKYIYNNTICWLLILLTFYNIFHKLDYKINTNYGLEKKISSYYLFSKIIFNNKTFFDSI